MGAPKGRCSSSPSVDKFDNDRGYVKGNVNVISNRANVLKNDATVAEMRAVLTYMEGGIAMCQALQSGANSLDCVTLTLPDCKP
jgi:hypothetical protein